MLYGFWFWAAVVVAAFGLGALVYKGLQVIWPWFAGLGGTHTFLKRLLIFLLVGAPLAFAIVSGLSVLMTLVLWPWWVIALMGALALVGTIFLVSRRIVRWAWWPRGFWGFCTAVTLAAILAVVVSIGVSALVHNVDWNGARSSERSVREPTPIIVEKIVTRVVEKEVTKIVEVEKEVIVKETVVVTVTVEVPVLVTVSSDVSSEFAEGMAARQQRLLDLDPAFRSGGPQAWLLKAGISWNQSFSFDARQPEETTVSVNNQTAVVLSGLQVSATELRCDWPCVVATDDPSRINVQSDTRSYRPDTRPDGNRSVLYTNVVATGPVTVYADGRDWGQMYPEAQVTVSMVTPTATPKPGTTPSATPTPVPSTVSCLSLTDLAKLGQIDQELTNEGQLAGAALTASKDFAVPSGWTAHVQDQQVTSVTKGQKVSMWSPEACRPLGR